MFPTSLQPHGLYVARQTPLAMGFSRQEYWGGLPFPSPGDLHDPGVESGSSTLQADSLPFEPKSLVLICCSLINGVERLFICLSTICIHFL